VASTLCACICTNRSATSVAPGLDALARGGASRVLLVLSGLDDGTAAAHEAAGAASVSVVREPRPGLSNARNRALAECADDDVVAFLDDDAIVGDGWLQAMHAAWEHAGSDVACIGGPIQPRFESGQRPAWLSDRLLPVLTTLDYGPEALDLDPSITTLYGANVSFRAGPLRDVGGFDPALGHGGRSTGFGEDDEAERALARAGYRIRYEPGPSVWHVIPAERARRAPFLRRRFDYGVGLGARNGRAPARALRQLASSAAGAPVAAAQRKSALAMERATRVAENAGVLLAPLLARR
jgi:glycosyltransferase involved in cell wall biosynthesis